MYAIITYEGLVRVNVADGNRGLYVCIITYEGLVRVNVADGNRGLYVCIKAL